MKDMSYYLSKIKIFWCYFNFLYMTLEAQCHLSNCDESSNKFDKFHYLSDIMYFKVF